MLKLRRVCKPEALASTRWRGIGGLAAVVPPILTDPWYREIAEGLGAAPAGQRWASQVGGIGLAVKDHHYRVWWQWNAAKNPRRYPPGPPAAQGLFETWGPSVRPILLVHAHGVNEGLVVSGDGTQLIMRRIVKGFPDRVLFPGDEPDGRRVGPPQRPRITAEPQFSRPRPIMDRVDSPGFCEAVEHHPGVAQDHYINVQKQHGGAECEQPRFEHRQLGPHHRHPVFAGQGKIGQWHSFDTPIQSSGIICDANKTERPMQPLAQCAVQDICIDARIAQPPFQARDNRHRIAGQRIGPSDFC